MPARYVFARRFLQTGVGYGRRIMLWYSVIGASGRTERGDIHLCGVLQPRRSCRHVGIVETQSTAPCCTIEPPDTVLRSPRTAPHPGVLTAPATSPALSCTPPARTIDQRAVHRMFWTGVVGACGYYLQPQGRRNLGGNVAAATSRTGNIAVLTTDQGLPTSVRIEPAELRKDPALLAAEVLRLCQQAAMKAGVARRDELRAGGVSNEIIDAMNLPRPDDLARAEYEDDAVAGAPGSWMRSV